MCVLSCFSHVRPFATPWTVARQAPLSMGFSRQEYWSGLPCPPPGDVPDPEIKPEAGRPNQSILKEISPEYSLEGLALRLKLQYFGHLMRRADSLEKTLMLGKIEGSRRGDKMVGWHHQLNAH